MSRSSVSGLQSPPRWGRSSALRALEDGSGGDWTPDGAVETDPEGTWDFLQDRFDIKNVK